MKNSARILSLIAVTAWTCLAATTQATAATQIGVSPDQPWQGYMNVFNLPADGGAYLWGSGWGIADLNASWSGYVLTLTPNTSIDRDVPNDLYWWKAPGPSGAPNKWMDANMYVQNDALAGQLLDFSGATEVNSLASPYTCVAFIKDFAPDYSSFTQSTMALVTGQAFDIQFATTAGHHIQYGFETQGPDARLANIANLGMAQVVPEPSTLAFSAVVLLGVAGRVAWRRNKK